MSNAGSKNALLTSAMLVAGIRLWMQLRGKTKTPFNEWVIGWGATFFFLALLSEASPQAAGGLSLVLAFSDFLVNGISLTTDVNSAITQSETNKGSSVFVPAPFASQPTSGKVAKG